MKHKITRKYLGVLVTSDNYKEILDRGGRFEVNFHNKHLRAYKKGAKRFAHGVEINDKGEVIGPRYHAVQARLSESE